MTRCRLAANAVCLGNTLVHVGLQRALRAQLEERGYRVVATPLPSFLRSGGCGVLPDAAARPQLATGGERRRRARSAGLRQLLLVRM